MVPVEERDLKKAVLFDLGNTLVQYYERTEFPSVVEEAILEVRAYLQAMGLPAISTEEMWQSVRDEDHEAADHRVRPLEGRLARIFQLDADQAGRLVEGMCLRFTGSIFARAICYPDAQPTLRRLRSRGIKTALVSNMPWGSPGRIWRRELVRHGLNDWLDVVVFCTDAGWRKPAPQIFELALKQIRTPPGDCLFVGDHPRWDVAGAQAMGMDAVLIDRWGSGSTAAGAISGLDELGGWLQAAPAGTDRA
jgi:putative hydrolase of the HAD superfamily